MQDLILMQRWFMITGFLCLMINGLYYKNKIIYFPLVSIYDIIFALSSLIHESLNIYCASTRKCLDFYGQVQRERKNEVFELNLRSYDIIFALSRLIHESLNIYCASTKKCLDFYGQVQRERKSEVFELNLRSYDII